MFQEVDQNLELKTTFIEDNLLSHSKEKDHNDVNVKHVSKCQSDEKSPAVAKSHSDEESSLVKESQPNEESSPVNKIIIDEKQYTKMRIKACLFITALLTILILMIIGLTKLYNELYETFENPEAQPVEVALSAYLILPVIGARSFLIVLIDYGVLCAFGIIPDHKNIQNTSPANDPAYFSFD